MNTSKGHPLVLNPTGERCRVAPVELCGSARRRVGLAAAGVLLVAAGLAACSSNSRPNPPPVPVSPVAHLSWDPVVETSDGSPLEDLAGYTVRYWPEGGSAAAAATAFATGPAADITISAGLWWFTVDALSATLGPSPSCPAVSASY